MAMYSVTELRCCSLFGANGGTQTALWVCCAEPRHPRPLAAQSGVLGVEAACGQHAPALLRLTSHFRPRVAALAAPDDTARMICAC
jgi:hypothetical protein